MKKKLMILLYCILLLAILFFGFHWLQSMYNKTNDPIIQTQESPLPEVSIELKPSIIPQPESPQPVESSVESPVENPEQPNIQNTKTKPKNNLTQKKIHILDMADSLPKPAPPKTGKFTIRIVNQIDDLLKNSVMLDLRNNEDDHTVTLTGLWRGEIKLNKTVSYLLIINRPWDYMTDEYLASSCVGVEEGGKSVYQKSLYNALKFYEIKNQIGNKDVFSLVCITGDKYVINVAIPPTEETTVTNGFAYYKQGKKLKYLGEVTLTKDTEYPKSECTDFEYKW
jgi:hypothetical protein